MSNPDFKYVEIALENFKRVGYIRTTDEIDEIINSKMVDCCRTWATYPVKLQYHCDKKNTISGYDGLVCADFIPIDIDVMDSARVVAVVEKFKEFDISLKNMAFYFSGRGFHIELPSDLFGIEPTPVKEFYARVKQLMTILEIDCDMSMYNTNQLYRLPNTINGKSGLYKIPIRYSELDSDLKELAKTPRFESFQDMDVDVDGTLNTLWLETSSDVISDGKDREYPRKTNNPIYTSIHGVDAGIQAFSGAPIGFRNNMASNYTRKLMMEGNTQDDAMATITAWNQTNTPPLTTTELNRTVQSNWRYSETFVLSQTKNFRANLRNDIVFKEYLTKPDKEPLSIYNYLILNINDEDKPMELDWGETVLIKRNQIMISNRSIAKRLNLKTKGGNLNEQKVRVVVEDLICKKRFQKHIIGNEPQRRRTILTWIHFDFTQ